MKRVLRATVGAYTAPLVLWVQTCDWPVDSLDPPLWLRFSMLSPITWCQRSFGTATIAAVCVCVCTRTCLGGGCYWRCTQSTLDAFLLKSSIHCSSIQWSQTQDHVFWKWIFLLRNNSNVAVVAMIMYPCTTVQANCVIEELTKRIYVPSWIGNHTYVAYV